VVALVLAAASLALARCPHDASLGTVVFPRDGLLRRFSFADCSEGAIGGVPPPRAQSVLVSPDGRFVARIRARRQATPAATNSIWVTDRATGRSAEILTRRSWATNLSSRDSPGPLELLAWSRDDSWILFTVDPGGSGSIAADGLVLHVVTRTGGTSRTLGVMLAAPDYLTWCRGDLVFTAGEGRVATHHKRLVVAAPPAWRPRLLWPDPARAFGSVACSPGGKAVAVLSQPDRDAGSFFAARWQLWRVGLDGSHTLLDRPPPGSADESPRWSRDGRSLLFVRERRGHGELMLWRNRHVSGPFATLGYSLGFYGHGDWWAGARWSAAEPR
jgi:dipeptidyl aminopeptidase/acylaminoacyl peptidase